MKTYRICGRHKLKRQNEHFDVVLENDLEAQQWAQKFCDERPSFMRSRLVEVIKVGDYREIPFL